MQSTSLCKGYIRVPQTLQCSHRIPQVASRHLLNLFALKESSGTFGTTWCWRPVLILGVPSPYNVLPRA